LLVNELTTGEDILDHLANYNRSGIYLSAEKVSKQLAEFKILCSKARAAWALAVFSEACKESLERYFTYHLKVICALSLKLYILPEIPIPECDCRHRKTIGELFEKETDRLIDHLFQFFGEYPDRQSHAPVNYSRHLLNVSKKDAEFIECALKNCCLPVEIKLCLLAYVQHMITETESRYFTFSQLFYFSNFLKEIKPILSCSSEAPLTERLWHKLWEIEFNHIDMVTWYQDKVRNSTAGKSKSKKIEIMEADAEIFHFAKERKTLCYDIGWPPLSLMLSAWLTTEIEKLREIKSTVPALRLAASCKLKLEMSVAHLACLLKLFTIEHLFGATPLTEVFEFFSANFYTKRAGARSAGGLSKEYYSITQVTAAEMKDQLLRMVHFLNREYFPALAAIGVLIGVC
jgi:hypothetical protein